MVGFAVGAIAEREMTADAGARLFRARGHHVIADLDELIPTLRRIMPGPDMARLALTKARASLPLPNPPPQAGEGARRSSPRCR